MTVQTENYFYKYNLSITHSYFIHLNKDHESVRSLKSANHNLKFYH